MKNAVVRARIDHQLKEQARAVLQHHGLEMSDAIRLFLQQVVHSGGLPFAVRDPNLRVVSGKHLAAMKRAEQARDRDLAAAGALPAEARLMLRPERLEGAEIQWPSGSLLDD